MMGRGTLGFHRPGKHRVHQALKRREVLGESGERGQGVGSREVCRRSAFKHMSSITCKPLTLIKSNVYS